MGEGSAAVLVDLDGTQVGTESNPLRSDPTGDTTQPISAESLPLPTGAATETGNLASIKAKTDSIPTDPAKESGKLTAIDSTLTSIKSTDGIKKIVDALPAGTNNIGDVDLASAIPAGTNEIGKVAQGTKAAGSAAWPLVIYDASGNVVGVVLDGIIYRVQTDAKVARGASALVHLDAIDTVSGQGRLKTTLYTPNGDAVAFGSVPSNPTSIRNEFVKNGAVESLLVNGSGTPQVFTYLADATYDISLQELKFVAVANAITFGSSAFIGGAGPLTNGLLVEIIASGNTGTIYNLTQNEGFVNFASPGGFAWVVSSKDMMSSTYTIGGGLKLTHGSADAIRVTVRDNLSSAGVYLKCFVKGNLLSVS